MKSKINCSLTLFICVLILTLTMALSTKFESSFESTNEVSESMLIGSDLTRKDLSHYWKKLFSGSREGTCKKSNAKKKAIAAIAAKGRNRGRKGEKTKLPWVKSWGYSDVAYFFDFLDPVFKKMIYDSMEESYETLKSIKSLY